MPLPTMKILFFWDEKSILSNMHGHGFCCEKGKRGKYMCRLVFKQGLHTSETCPLLIVLFRLENIAKNMQMYELTPWMKILLPCSMHQIMPWLVNYTSASYGTHHMGANKIQTRCLLLWKQHHNMFSLAYHVIFKCRVTRVARKGSSCYIQVLAVSN